MESGGSTGTSDDRRCRGPILIRGPFSRLSV